MPHSSPLPAFNPSNSSKPPTHRKEAGRDKSESWGSAGAWPHPALPVHLFWARLRRASGAMTSSDVRPLTNESGLQLEPLISHLQASGRHPRWSWECILAPSQIHIFSCFFLKACHVSVKIHGFKFFFSFFWHFTFSPYSILVSFS